MCAGWRGLPLTELTGQRKEEIHPEDLPTLGRRLKLAYSTSIYPGSVE